MSSTLNHGLQLRQLPQKVVITHDNNVLLQQHIQAGRRPFIHPLRCLDGQGVLTEDSPAHHPWQHGLYIGLRDVGGSDFWLDQGEQVGRIEAQSARQLSDAAWSVQSAWRHHDGQLLLHDTQRWQIQILESCFILDLQWSLQACMDVSVARHPYGGLFLRMPYRGPEACTVINSNGQRDEACEQAAANWVAVAMPVPGRATPAGVAIMSHPANRSTMLRWRVDAERGINPSPCIDGPWQLSADRTATQRYRLLVFAGPIDAEAIAARWQEYLS